MSTYLGKDGTVKVVTDTSDPPGHGDDTPAAVGEITSWSVETEAQIIEDTAAGDSWRTRKSGLKSWSATIAAHWDGDDAAQADLVEGAGVDVELYFEDKANSGDNYFKGYGIVQSVRVSADHQSDTPNPVEFTLIGSGELQRGTIT